MTPRRILCPQAGQARRSNRHAGKIINEFKGKEMTTWRARKILPGKDCVSNALLTVILDNGFEGKAGLRVSEAALHRHPTGDARVRVRTPGKHIVLFLLAVTFMLALSTSVIRGGRDIIASLEQDKPTEVDGRVLAAPQEFLLDLAPDAAGVKSYLRLRTALAYDSEVNARAAQAREAAIRERIIAYLRALSPEDFEDEDDMNRLKAGLVHRATLAAPGAAPRDAVILDIAIQ